MNGIGKVCLISGILGIAYNVERRARMINIESWLRKITAEQFRDFIMIRDYECKNCPASDYCNAEDDDKCCEEEFYKWAKQDEKGGQE